MCAHAGMAWSSKTISTARSLSRVSVGGGCPISNAYLVRYLLPFGNEDSSVEGKDGVEIYLHYTFRQSVCQWQEWNSNHMFVNNINLSSYLVPVKRSSNEGHKCGVSGRITRFIWKYNDP